MRAPVHRCVPPRRAAPGSRRTLANVGFIRVPGGTANARLIARMQINIPGTVVIQIPPGGTSMRIYGVRTCIATSMHGFGGNGASVGISAPFSLLSRRRRGESALSASLLALLATSE